MLTGLRHGAVGGGHDQDSAVHLGGTGDHVLDIVGVTGAVDVSVVTVVRLVLDVRDRDGDTALTLFGCLVDLVERREVRIALLGQRFRDRRGERRLTMVDVTDGTDVHMRLGALELLLRHESPPLGAVTVSGPLGIIPTSHPSSNNVHVTFHSYIQWTRRPRRNPGSGDWIRTSDNTGMNRAL